VLCVWSASELVCVCVRSAGMCVWCLCLVCVCGALASWCLCVERWYVCVVFVSRVCVLSASVSVWGAGECVCGVYVLCVRRDCVKRVKMCE